MDNKKFCKDVVAILVTYNPDLLGLNKSLNAILGQVSDLYIIDNGSLNFSSNWLNIMQFDNVSTNLHLLPLMDNFGISAAHNIGIRHAINQSAKFVLLLDQDSVVSTDMVSKLRYASYDLINKGVKLAAIGPQYSDGENVELSQFVKVGLFNFTHCKCQSDSNIVEADFLVSSGSLITVGALNHIGLMDEDLFIDHVDTEWFFRAKSRGFKVFGLCGTVMTHSLGEQRIQVNLLRKLKIPVHKPFRYYYMFRNSILLYRRGYMPLRWKLADFTKCLKMVVFFIVFSECRFEVFKMMSLGVIDGLRGSIGKLKNC